MEVRNKTPMTIEQMEARLLKQEQIINELRLEIDQLKKEGTESSLARVLHAEESFGDLAEQPPLDSPIIWKRGQKQATPSGYTTQILSLISEVAAVEGAYPWPLYIQLKTSHKKGDAVGATVRLLKGGDGWGTAYHAETFHDGGQGATMGVNIESHKGKDAGRSVGLNIQSVAWQMDGTIKDPTIVDEAINIQCHEKAHWKTGIHFDQGSRGIRAVWIEGKWDVGIDTGDNCIRMNKGAEFCFEETRRFYMKYNPEKNRIEFHNRGEGKDRVIGYISADAPEHEL